MYLIVDVFNCGIGANDGFGEMNEFYANGEHHGTSWLRVVYDDLPVMEHQLLGRT
jgi:hypothetical protein